MTIPKDNSQLENARRLRSEMTPHERKLWYLFLRKYPVKIYKQRIIGRFIVDFYCASAKLVIELDGSQHYEPQGMAYDSERSAFLNVALFHEVLRSEKKRLKHASPPSRPSSTKYATYPLSIVSRTDHASFI